MVRKRRRKKYSEIAPDEIFLDSSNLPEFDVNQFEGRIEKPVKANTIILLGAFFLLLGFIFTYRLADLQVANGSWYKERSERNHLRHLLIFPERGVIYDKNKEELVWNTSNNSDDFFSRKYTDESGLAHLLGYVSYPQKDHKGIYYQEEFIGKDGVEKYYNDILSGERGLKIIEVDVMGDVQSESSIVPKIDGADITLSIDARVQNKLYEEMEALSSDVGFSGGAGIIIDVENGEILAMTSFPEYNSSILSDGSDTKVISSYVTNKNTPFLNRVVSGLYTPGSTVKPFLALGALHEEIISPTKSIFSSGEISIQNPYFPDKKSVFKDWKAHGWVDVYKAIAMSSNVYFYAIGGGYEDQEGLGIKKIEVYTRMFGLGESTGVDLPGEVDGVIPNPDWKEDNFEDGEWRVGDTYHTAIGQYGFQITPIQLARAIAVLANGGKEINPHVLIGINDTQTRGENIISGIVKIDEDNFDIIKKGMRQAVTEGSAKGLNLSYVKVAAKTGTAELGVSKSLVNSWITGFFPYENPRYAFAVVMEKGPRDNLIGALYVMRQLLDWMSVETPEYFEK
ncbi:penicillin-binding transpeptidase domain-containing protein [Patescibacteria group bacterium]